MEAQGGIVPAARETRSARARDVEVTVHFTSAVASTLRELQSPSHLVIVDTHPEGGTRVRLGGATDTALPNADFVLDWRASDEGVRPWLFVERKRGETGTFLLSLTPSVPRPSLAGTGEMKVMRCGNCGAPITDLAAVREIPGLGPVVPCVHCRAILTPGTEVITRPARPKEDVLVLVDRSASMRGTDTAHAVARILGALAHNDAAQVVVFDHEPDAIGGDPARFFAVSPELVAEAEALVRAHSPRGGSEIEASVAPLRADPRPRRTHARRRSRR